MQKSLKTFQIYPRLKLKWIRNERKHHQAGQQQLLRNQSWAGEVAQWVRALATEPEPVPITHFGMCAYSPNKANKCKRVIKAITNSTHEEWRAISYFLFSKTETNTRASLLITSAQSCTGEIVKGHAKGKERLTGNHTRCGHLHIKARRERWLSH